MQQTIEILRDAGFTPLNIILIIALIKGAMWAAATLKEKLEEQNALREGWHDETRMYVSALKERVDCLQADRLVDIERIDECEKDRKTLNEQVRALSSQLEIFRACPRQSCPFIKK